MTKIFFTPGPSKLYPTVISHLNNALEEQIPSISHRSKQFEEIYLGISEGLKKLLNIPKNYYIFIVASGTEAMERTIQNCVEKYSFHFVNGSFSKRLYTTAKELGKNPKLIERPFGQGFDFEKIKIPKTTEIICFTQNETSSGVMIPEEEIHKIARKNKSKLIAVDIVSSVPYVNLEYHLLDVVFFSVQKGFGLPAGLGIMIVSPRAIKKAEVLQKKGLIIGTYHNFLSLKKFEEKNQNPETPPILEMYLLNKVIQDMLSIGIKNIRKEIEKNSSYIYNFLSKNKLFSAFVKDKKFRSKTIIVVNVGEKQKSLKKYLNDKGLVVGSGYGEYKSTQIRIANLPAHTKKDIKRLILQINGFLKYSHP